MKGPSVCETTVARAFADRAGRVLAATLFLLAIALVAPKLARAANEAANIDQCRNGQLTAPVQCANSAWVNGNLGPENSHYREGDSVPFRATLTGIDTSVTNHTLTIQYDTLQSGKHAYDYLTSFNRTEATADPTTGVSVSGSATCFPIPVDLSIAFNNPGSSQIPGCISIWNGTITAITYGTMDAIGQRSVIVTFTATDPTVLLAWGGHIATQVDWGAGNSAGAISGSPYHMRLLTLDDVGLGNQDRSLKASTISPVPAVFTTQASSGQITLTGSVTDTATLSGSNGPVTGTVKFFVCGPANANPDCSSGGTQVGNAVTIAADQATSDSFTPGATGHYCFRAEYTPDQFAPYSPSNHSDTTLECFTVTAQTALNTNAGGPFTIGVDGTVALSDTATLSGGTSDATGTITFKLYSDDSCQTQVGGDVTTTVNHGADGKNYISPSITVTAAGTYHWVASFSSDDPEKNADTTTDCGAPNENPVVNARETSLTTDAGGPFVLGANGTVALNDTATLSGGTSGAGGTITFMLFSDAACANQVGSDVTVGVDGADGQNYPSPSITVNAPGTYYWVAIYGGDTNNAASSTVCGDENETPVVIKPHISVSKSPDAQTILIGQTANFTIAVTNDGDSTLTNVVVTDALAPGCARTSADIPALASMAAGATVTYTCSLANVVASFTNVAVATGTPPVGPNVTAQDTAGVTAVAPATHPAITVVKNPKSQTVTVGNKATFTITVTNTGDVALTNVTVTDAQSPNCNRTIGTLAPGASTSYTCTRANVTSSFTNVAVASGTAGGTTVKAQDSAPVTAKAKPFVPPKVKPKVVSHKKPKATG
jgi:uncharacterized repeat protein (TIGR01451 family)